MMDGSHFTLFCKNIVQNKYTKHQKELLLCYAYVKIMLVFNAFFKEKMNFYNFHHF